MSARVLTIEQKAKGGQEGKRQKAKGKRQKLATEPSKSKAKLFSLALSFTFAFCLLPFAFCLTSFAQQASRAMGPDFMDGVPGTYAIRNARIVPVVGAEIENGTVVVRDGKIEAVGANVSVPAGVQEIDARGLSVYPGMIDLGTSMGLVEIPQGASGTVDLQEIGELNPNSQAYFGINPHSAHIAVTRVNGVTSVLSSPQGGIISGQAAFINLLGSTPQAMALVPDAALVVDFPRAGGGRGGNRRTSPKRSQCATDRSNNCANSCATQKPTGARRTRRQETRICRAPMLMLCSRRLCLTCAASAPSSFAPTASR